MQQRTCAAAGLAAGFVATAPTPALALQLLTVPVAPVLDLDGATLPLVGALALLGWAVLAWLALLVALLLAGRLPGTIGRLGRLLVAALAPIAVRRTLALTLGLGLATGSPAAWAAGSTDPLDWPVTHQPAVTLTLPSPSAAPTVTAPASTPAPAAAPAGYVVQPGDSLWSIAAGQLPPGASAARIATAWPTWWSANRDRLGADPDLIHPGTRLTPPSTVKE